MLVKAARHRGLHVTMIHPRRVKLANVKFKSDWIAPRPGTDLALLHAITRAALDLGDPQGVPAEVASGLASLKQGLAEWSADAAAKVTGVPAQAIRDAARRLREAPDKAIVFGRAIAEHPTAPALLQAIENLAWATGANTAARSSVMYIGPHAGSQGALDMGLTPDRLPGYVAAGDAERRRPFEQQWAVTLPTERGMSAPEILRAAADGKIRALWIASDEWIRSAPDRALVEKALDQAELVIVNELFLTGTARKAHVVFPVAAFAEKEGVMVNCERRMQKTVRALPPRKGTRADWEVFQLVAQALGAKWTHRSAEDVWREIARLVPGYQGTMLASMIPYGPQWSLAAPAAAASFAASQDGVPAAGPQDGMWVLSGGVLFLQGSLSHRTELLPRLAKDARVRLHPDDAKKLGVADGDALELTGPSGSLRVPALADDSVPAGSVFLPYAYPGVEVNRLGMPVGAGLKVRVAKVAAGQTVGA
jgi:formate dehydrogenase major subunit